MRYFLFFFGLSVLAVMLVAGKRGDKSTRPPLELFPDMDRQAKLRPQTAEPFFSDSLSSRLHVAGTVARGTPYENSPLNTGKVPGTTNWLDLIPVPVTESLMARGRERYLITCVVCHGATGDGKGITSKYGMLTTANLHELRFIVMTDGEIFNTITQGKGLMGSYGAQLAVEDRWAVIAYVRALQRTRLAKLADVPAGDRERMTRAMQPGAAAGTP